MYTLAHFLELITLFCAFAGIILASLSLYKGNASLNLAFVEKASLGISAGHAIASVILLYAFLTFDFSLEYVSSYSDRTLPLFYRITAFWAGQAGSLLFWALMVALCNAAFQLTQTYKALSAETKQWYWIFYCSIMAFFGLLLTTWSDPFVMNAQVPMDGRGMNPLLQNPGMIIHPPLLFLGYGGFTIPSCLALAQSMSRNHSTEASWFQVGRPFIITAWIFLTAGILLGAWWAYMELGWGGYWAWDPVENASLLPWLVGTAALHTMIIEQRRNKLHRVNVFLIALTTVTAFFATYLVRGNVVDSVHAFGSGGVGPALLIFVLASTFLITLVAFSAPKVEGAEDLANINTREGFLVFTAWILITLSLIILVGTLFPVFSTLWSPQSIGLDANFYNAVCLPLFTVLAAMLVVCPYLGWNGGIKNIKDITTVALAIVLAMVLFYIKGYNDIFALISSSLAVGIIVSSAIMLYKPSSRSFMPRFAAHGVHLAFALIVLGVAFSGEYKLERDVTLGRGESAQLGDYVITLNELYEGEAATFAFLEAEIIVSKNGKILGQLSPQKRIYNKFSQQSFSEVGTMPSIFTEVYASLHGLDNNSKAVMRVSLNPLVNWIWAGSILMCLFPFLAIKAITRREDDE